MIIQGTENTNYTYIHPFPEAVFKRYRKTEYQWEKIPRASRPDKYLSEKALKILSNAVIKLQKEDIITYTHAYLSKLTKCQHDQNNNLLKELSEILKIKFHRVVTIEGKKYRNRFVISYTKDGIEILNDPEKYYSLKAAKNKEAEGEKIRPLHRKNSASYIRIIKEDNNISNIDNNINTNARAREKNDEYLDFKLNSPIYFDSSPFLQNVEPKKLKDFYPLDDEDAHRLRTQSGRNFYTHFMNELLKKMSNKNLEAKFYHKDSFINYFAITLKNEQRKEEKVNNLNFRLKANMTREDHQQAKAHKFLNEIEQRAILSVSPENTLKAKIANAIEPSRAYKILQDCKIDINKQSTCTKVTISFSDIEPTENEKQRMTEQAAAIYASFYKDLDIVITTKKTQTNMPNIQTNKRLSEDVYDKCDIIEMDDNRIGVCPKNSLSEEQKSYIRDNIYQTFGDDVKIVVISAKKPKQATPVRKEQPLTLFEQFCQYFDPTTTNTWLKTHKYFTVGFFHNPLKEIQTLNLTGNDFAVDHFTERFCKEIEKAVIALKIDVVFSSASPYRKDMRNKKISYKDILNSTNYS